MSDEDRDGDELRAYQVGVERGWDHANFTSAYGKEHDRRTPDYPAWLHLEMIGPPGRQWIRQGQGTGISVDEASLRLRLRQHFDEGWKEGRKLFSRGRYTDGTKIEN